MTGQPKDIGSISLEQIVRFAGAVQDFNPIHYDDAFARKAGLPGVIAHGPLTFLVALNALIADMGVDKLRGFQARLKAPVTPGSPLTMTRGSDGAVSLKAAGTEALSGTIIGVKATP